MKCVSVVTFSVVWMPDYKSAVVRELLQQAIPCIHGHFFGMHAIGGSLTELIMLILVLPFCLYKYKLCTFGTFI